MNSMYLSIQTTQFLKNLRVGTVGGSVVAWASQKKKWREINKKNSPRNLDNFFLKPWTSWDTNQSLIDQP